MRIHFKIKSSNDLIPYDHQHLLTGALHKWLGKRNEEHGSLSLYSFSRLVGGLAKPEGLLFQKGGSFYFSAYDSTLIKKTISGIQKDPDMFFGLAVQEIIIEEEPDLTNRELFQVGSPVFIKRREESNILHVLYKDANAGALLEETLKSKMKVIGLEDDSVKISFQVDYQKASTKLIKYKGIENRASWCPVIIKGRAETKLFAWNVGVGNSTGIGFGAIQ